MTVEFIGWMAPRVSSEILPPNGPPFDRSVIATTAHVHEEAGFDRVLVGYFSNAPDGFLVAAHGAAVTERLAFLLAHRPGFVAPTVAARKLATLDQLSDGRLAVHIISGGSDADQARDGDFLERTARYRRSAEYVRVLRQTWESARPFDHEGEFYRVQGAFSEVRAQHGGAIPVYGGGGSDAAVEMLAPELDTFMIWGEPLAEAAAFMDRVRAIAARAGRSPGFSVSTRPILGRTDGEAWDRAKQVLERVQASRTGPPPTPPNAGSQRLLDAAERGEVWDTCLWTPLAVATGAQGNSTALVGSPETVAEALAAYYGIGATSLLIRGYDPLADAEEYGRELIPRVRDLVAQRDRALASSGV
ncbi:MAG: LLM class flavin-dependent oxidoreductase [Acidimicrobiia bacterium]|nr:LLM class flavin-dependent oxidoreductase [Acidimicrobiia bacterium]